MPVQKKKRVIASVYKDSGFLITVSSVFYGCKFADSCLKSGQKIGLGFRDLEKEIMHVKRLLAKISGIQCKAARAVFTQCVPETHVGRVRYKRSVG